MSFKVKKKNSKFGFMYQYILLLQEVMFVIHFHWSISCLIASTYINVRLHLLWIISDILYYDVKGKQQLNKSILFRSFINKLSVRNLNLNLLLKWMFKSFSLVAFKKKGNSTFI